MPNYVSLKNIINTNNITFLSLVLFFSIAITNLVSTNVLSTQGIGVSVVESETLNIEKENQRLVMQIEEASKLKDLEKVAQNQGFTRVSSMVFAPTPATVALR